MQDLFNWHANNYTDLFHCMCMCICTFTMTPLKRVLTVGLCCSFLFLELQLAVWVSSSISCQPKIAFSCSEGNCMYRVADIYLNTSYLPNRDKLHAICLTCSLSWKFSLACCPTLFTVLTGVTLAVTAWFHGVQWAHKWIMHHMQQYSTCLFDLFTQACTVQWHITVSPTLYSSTEWLCIQLKQKLNFCRTRNFVLNLALATFAAFDLYFVIVCNNIIVAIW